MNSNAFHNAMNIASVVLAAVTAALLQSGCVQDAAGAFDCSKSFISPMYTVVAIGVVQAAKIVVNIVRDGLGGLIKPQPPVQK